MIAITTREVKKEDIPLNYWIKEERDKEFKIIFERGRYFNLIEILSMTPQEKVDNFSMKIYAKTSAGGGAYSMKFHYYIGGTKLGESTGYLNKEGSGFCWDLFYPVNADSYQKDERKGKKIGTIAHTSTLKMLLRCNLVTKEGRIVYPAEQSHESIEWRKRLGIFHNGLTIVQELKAIADYATSKRFTFYLDDLIT